MGIKIIFGVIAFCNALLAFAAHSVTMSFSRIFVELLDGEPLPVFPSIMLWVTPIWPVLFIITSIVFLNIKVNKF